MSFAIIQTGGKQYKVKASEILKIEQLEKVKPETKIEFNEILAYGDEKNIEVGSPLIKGAKVEAELLKNGKNRTVLVFKKRRRKNSRKKYGHRQPISLIRITKIFSKDGKLIAQAEPKKELTKEIVKAEKVRKEQKKEAKKIESAEKIRLKKAAEKIEAKTKKSDLTKKKTIDKKKPLTTKKK